MYCTSQRNIYNGSIHIWTMDPELWSCSRKPFIDIFIVLISMSTMLLELEIVEFVLVPIRTALRYIWYICQLWQARGSLLNSRLFHAALLDQSSHESLEAWTLSRISRSTFPTRIDSKPCSLPRYILSAIFSCDASVPICRKTTRSPKMGNWIDLDSFRIK